MKALSLWQPWASLWACGRKKYETRHWATSYRGPLAVHAAKKISAGADITEELRDILIDEFGGHWMVELPRGALIATATLVDCRPTGGLWESVGDEELAQGNFTPGRYGWKVANMIALPQPIPYTGHQSLFEVPNEVFSLPPAAIVQRSLL